MSVCAGSNKHSRETMRKRNWGLLKQTRQFYDLKLEKC